MKEKKFRNKSSRGPDGRADLLIGRNPVTEALRSGRAMERILVQDGSGGSIGKILSLAKKCKASILLTSTP